MTLYELINEITRIGSMYSTTACVDTNVTAVKIDGDKLVFNVKEERHGKQ